MHVYTFYDKKTQMRNRYINLHYLWNLIWYLLVRTFIEKGRASTIYILYFTGKISSLIVSIYIIGWQSFGEKSVNKLEF
jgi:prolipoprotein diacylglyceryltransferase